MLELEVIGDYLIEKKLSADPFGTTYLAEHRFVKKPFMLKVLAKELSENERFIEQFEKHIHLLAEWNHPNVIKTHSMSFVEGRHILVMDPFLDDYSELTSLSKYLVLHPKQLKEETIKVLLWQIASALDYIHAESKSKVGTVHRFLNPQTLLLDSQEHVERVAICDVGLANIVGEGTLLTRSYQAVIDQFMIPQADSFDSFAIVSEDERELKPLHRAFLESYHYLAPEQKIITRAKPIDPTADTYAFGVLAYVLLMRSYPEGHFVLPSTKRKLKYNWDQLILDCMHHDTSERPLQLMECIESISFSQDSVKNHADSMQMTLDGIVETSADSSSNFEYRKAVDPNKELMRETVGSQRDNNDHSEDQKPTSLENQLNKVTQDKLHGAVDKIVNVYKPKEPRVKDVAPIPTKMIEVSEGEYYRGNNDSARDQRPYHRVYLNAFSIDIHPVTNEQFKLFLEAMGTEKDHNHHDMIKLHDSRISKVNGHYKIESGYAKHPVVGISWYGACAYASWCHKRLPTEAEWEVAARALDPKIEYPIEGSLDRSKANYFASDTTKVMRYEPNSLGLYDMAGNVYEWCHDWYHYNYYDTSALEPTNPHGPVQGVYRVLRGGCWKSLEDDLRCYHRHRNHPASMNSTYGFRCASDGKK